MRGGMGGKDMDVKQAAGVKTGPSEMLGQQERLYEQLCNTRATFQDAQTKAKGVAAGNLQSSQ